MVTNYGTVGHHIIDIPQNINDSDLLRISNILNSNLAGKTLSEITNDIMDAIKDEMIEYDEILNILLEILLENLGDSQDNTPVISTGSSKMLDYRNSRMWKKQKLFPCWNSMN